MNFVNPTRHVNSSPQTKTNVAHLRLVPAADPVREFNALTHQLVMDRHRAGTLDPGVLEALLVGVGLEP